MLLEWYSWRHCNEMLVQIRVAVSHQIATRLPGNAYVDHRRPGQMAALACDRTWNDLATPCLTRHKCLLRFTMTHDGWDRSRLSSMMYPVDGEWQDSVPRQREFESKHPEITIWADRWGWEWYAQHGEKLIAHTRSLKTLLDELERLCG